MKNYEDDGSIVRNLNLDEGNEEAGKFANEWVGVEDGSIYMVVGRVDIRIIQIDETYDGIKVWEHR